VIDTPPRADAALPLTAEQRLAVEARDRDVFCEAGAGSGKTRVLVERYCAAVADDGIAIERILAFTFTERAAAELRGRIRRALTDRARAATATGDGERARELTTLARASERAWVTTIHGFCRRLLASRPAAAGLDPRFRVLDEGEAARLREAAVAEALADLARREPEPFGRALAAYRPWRFAEMVLAAHARLRSQGMPEPRLPALGEPIRSVNGACDDAAVPALTPAELDAAREARAALEAALEAFGRGYEEAKAARSALDFADLELRALELLRTTPAGGEWRERFDHILVDEFQDTNTVQVELVEALRGPAARLFVVGDENQSIYRFRNAELEVFRAERVRARESGAEMVSLRGNFRSTPQVLGAVNALGATLLDGFVPLVAARRPPAGATAPELLLTLEDGREATWSDERIDLEAPPSETRPEVVAEARNLALRLRELVEEGVERGRIVVLLRAFTHVDAYEDALRRCGLRPYVVGGRGYWSQQQVEDVIRLLATIANPLDDELLLGALASPAVGVRPDALWLLRRAAGEGRHLWPAIEWAFGSGDREPADIAAERLAAIEADDDERLRRFCARLARLRAEAPVLGLEELVDRTITAFGYDLALLARSGGPGRMANVRKLMRLAREFERLEGCDLRGFLEAAAESTRRDEREGMAALAAEDHDGVRVMTVHAAKGLEFEVVAVPDLGRKLGAGHRWEDVVIGSGEGRGRFGMRLVFPSAKSFGLWELVALNQEARAAEAAESCRLVHVAATRATDRLILSGVYRRRDLEPVDEPRPSDSPLRRFLPALVERGWEGGDGAVAAVPLAIALNDPSPARAAVLIQLHPEPPAAEDEAARRPPPLIEGRWRPVPVGHLSYSALSSYERCGYRFYAERVLGLGAIAAWSAAGEEIEAAGDGAAPEPADEIPDPPASGEPVARERSLAFGRAVHRALEWSARNDWRSPPDELLRSYLVEAGGAIELIPRAAAMVAGWLESPLRAEVGAAPSRAEVPFALPLGGTVVRGKIDLLAKSDRRTVIDFKTDELRGRPTSALAGRYRVQREIYALAAAGAGGGEAVRAIHVFLEDAAAPIVDDLGPLELAAARGRVESLIGRIRGGEFAPTAAPEAAVCFGCPAAAYLCPNAAWRPPR
jgi:ATP-dependent helicase/nuclease subunit A